jgi:hypothetical protein
MAKIQFPIQEDLQLPIDLNYGDYKLVHGLVPNKEVAGEGIYLGALVPKDYTIPNDIIFNEVSELEGVFAHIQSSDVEEVTNWLESIATYKR